MQIVGAPSLAGIIGHARECLSQKGVVFLHLPPVARAQKWEEELVSAIAPQRGTTVVVINEAETDPERMLCQFLETQACDLELALESAMRDPEPLVIALELSAAPSASLLRLLVRLARLHEKSELTLRPILVLCRGQRVRVGEDSPVVQHFLLWNPLRWQDMHGLAAAWLETNGARPLKCAWQVASYVGASNGDPFLLRAICDTLPESLGALYEVIAALATSTGRCDSEIDWLPRTELRWNVPASCERQWEAGQLLGFTVERGPQIPWETLAPDFARAHAARLIWQEQVATLMPMLMEFTHQVAVWLGRHVDPDWMRFLEAGTHEELEPGKILTALNGPGRPRVPDAIWRLLHTLRCLRNELAHRKPVDAASVIRLWEEFCGVQQRFGQPDGAL
jgi:hypothetical protein